MVLFKSIITKFSKIYLSLSSIYDKNSQINLNYLDSNSIIRMNMNMNDMNIHENGPFILRPHSTSFTNTSSSSSSNRESNKNSNNSNSDNNKQYDNNSTSNSNNDIILNSEDNVMRFLHRNIPVSFQHIARDSGVIGEKCICVCVCTCLYICISACMCIRVLIYFFVYIFLYDSVYINLYLYLIILYF